MHLVLGDLGFPVWLRATHWINAFLIGFMIRSGIQILASYPRLHWGEVSTPGTEWLKFTNKKFRTDKYYITLEEEEDVSPVLAQPGGSNLGLGRHFHFFAAMFWILTGVVYVALLFITGEWSRLVPTSWAIFPNAWETMVNYLTFHAPPHSLYLGVYDPLQQLAYFAVVFLLAPFMIVTAAAQSPAIEGYFPWYAKLFGGRQGARSLHFLGLVGMVAFIFIHTAMVFLTGPMHNFGDIIFGQHTSGGGVALTIGLVMIALIFVIYGVTSIYSQKHATKAQRFLSAFIRPWMVALSRKLVSRQHYKPSQISDFFIVNGAHPESPEYLRMLWNGFSDYRLEIGGRVAHPLSLSLADLKALRKQSQITKHNCIQGWTSIGEWGGVPMATILEMVKPHPDAHYVVFRSYSQDNAGKDYFETISIDVAKHPQTILAYEMNGHPLPMAHGAPLRLRAEVLLGFKMVKWIRSIEFVETYATVREGLGGSREENKHYEQAVPI